MKRLCFAALALAGGAVSAAHAQSSVTLYGIADSGILYKTHAAAGGGSAWSVASGIDSTSRWGLTGREDLGVDCRHCSNSKAPFASTPANPSTAASRRARATYYSIAARQSASAARPSATYCWARIARRCCVS
ncbi:porin [Paraburkholderia phymatum]|uniref:Porin n=1 Tax=Paraburkholderia phymatum TaxID=148447 RepID=A0ACC6UBU4_9BURK